MEIVQLLLIACSLALCWSLPSAKDQEKSFESICYFMSIPSNREVVNSSPRTFHSLKEIIQRWKEERKDKLPDYKVIFREFRSFIEQDLIPKAFSQKYQSFRTGSSVITLPTANIKYGKIGELDHNVSWPIVFEFSDVSPDYFMPKESTTSAVLAEFSTNQTIRTLAGTAVKYRLHSLLFETQTHDFIRFELEKQHDSFVLVNKSSSDFYKTWTLDQFKSAALIPYNNFFNAYYVRVDWLNALHSFKYGDVVQPENVTLHFNDEDVAVFGISTPKDSEEIKSEEIASVGINSFPLTKANDDKPSYSSSACKIHISSIFIFISFAAVFL